MARLIKKDGKAVLEFDDSELQNLGLKENLSYEIARATAGIFVLIEKQSAETKPSALNQNIINKNVNTDSKDAINSNENSKNENSNSETDKKIFSMLKEKELKDRVEGKFETFLNEEEKKRLRELIADKKVIPFKLSDKYKKSVYELPEMRQNPNKIQPSDYSFQKDGYQVITNENMARQISQDHEKDFKSRLLKGIKASDNTFYLITSGIYKAKRDELIKFIEKAERDVTIYEIADAMKSNEILARIVCEFVKEEGEISEKRKDLFKYVKE